MSGSNQNSNYPQELGANCPRSARLYASEGRSFTQGDLNPRALDPTHERSKKCVRLLSVDDTTEDFSPEMEYGTEGRPFNPAIDISGNRPARSQHPYQHKQLSQKDSRLNLEYEMARNKEIALERLRAEQSASRSACSRPQVCHEGQPQMVISSRGRELDMKAEIQRQQAQADSSNACMMPVRRNINAGRPVDMDRVYNYNMPGNSPAGKCGRPMDLQRDLTFRRLNLPTPKQQRATSCPTPVQYGTPHSSIQRMPKICPRPSQSISVSPARSISPSEAIVSRYATPMQQMPARSPRAPGKYSATPVCRPIRTPVGGLGETFVDSPGNITKTVTTTITTRPIIPQETPICPTPQKSPDSPPQTYNETTPRRKQQNISNITQDTLGQMDSAYGQTPARGSAAERPFKTPRQSQNVTDSSFPCRTNNTQMESIRQELDKTPKAATSLNKTQIIPPAPPLPPLDLNSFNCDLPRSYRSADQSRTHDQSCYYDNEYRTMDKSYSPQPSRTCPTPMQPRSPHLRQAPLPESCYYNASMFDEPSHYRRRPGDCPEKSFIDLTDETQYQCDAMDISEQESLSRSACPVKRQDGRRMDSWRIPPQDLTCYERSGHENYSIQQPALSTTMVQTSAGTLGTEYDATIYKELPSQLKPRRPICPPCEQPKASLFRCLAKKLSSTYDFISSLVAPQKSATDITLPKDQRRGQECDETTFGLNTLFNTSCPNDTTTFDLRNLYATQCNETTDFGLNTLSGNRTQLMDDSTSLKECANAKRCGRVQFDSSDKYKVQDPQRSIIRKAEIENLVKDTYCPGIIQETIDGRENFNNYSFNISVDQESKNASRCEGPPAEDPMTLLEAFSIRIENQRAEIQKDLTENATEDQIKDIIHKYFAQQNPSDLNRSIKSLLLSERLQEQEQAAKSIGSSVEADVQKLVTTFPVSGKTKLVAYTGHTKAIADATI